MKMLDMLADAREAIQNFQPQRASALLETFESQYPLQKMSKAQADRVEAELRKIATMAEAAREGVAQAQQQVKQLLALSQSLGTYDRTGALQVQQTAPRPVRKF